MRYTPREILRRAARPRVIIYTAILTLLTAATAWSLATRIPLKVNILKDRNVLSREADDGSIENIYRLQIMNTGDQLRTFRITIGGIDGIRLAGDDQVTIAGGEIGTQTAVVKADAGATRSGAATITFDVADVADAGVAVTERSKFWMP
jgi:polyferredoxin